MTYTIAQAREVMAETKRILAEDARLGRRVTAQAAAKTKPPSANDLYFNEILELMEEEGLTKAEAVRRVGCEKPTLAQAYVDEENRKRQKRSQRDRAQAARVRNRNR